MSQLREDPLTGRRVLIAENRSGRPNEFTAPPIATVEDVSPRADCVFCPGNESLTPGATLEILDAAGDWQVRAFPNKYPAVQSDADQGVHEVIVESREHVLRTGQLSVEQLARVLDAYAQRLSAVADDPRYPYRLLFKNVGASAGASLEHLHSQLIALPTVPTAIADELARLANYRSRNQSSGWADRINEERAVGKRVIFDGGAYFAFCPAASRQAFETWILPDEQQSRFESTISTRDEARSLAQILSPVIRSVEAEIEPAGYNMAIHTAPGVAGDREFHWRLEIVPRVASLAGLELATGLFMNVLSPERAAEKLRARIATLSTDRA